MLMMILLFILAYRKAIVVVVVVGTTKDSAHNKKTVTSLLNKQCIEQRHVFPRLIRNIVITSVKDLSLASVHVCFC